MGSLVVARGGGWGRARMKFSDTSADFQSLVILPQGDWAAIAWFAKPVPTHPPLPLAALSKGSPSPLLPVVMATIDFPRMFNGNSSANCARDLSLAWAPLSLMLLIESPIWFSLSYTFLHFLLKGWGRGGGGAKKSEMQNNTNRDKTKW